MQANAHSVPADQQDPILATLRLEVGGKAGAPRAITVDRLSTEGLSFCSDRELPTGTILNIAIRSTRDEGSALCVTECTQRRGQFEVMALFVRNQQGAISGTMMELLRERSMSPKPIAQTTTNAPADKRRTRRHPTRELGIIAPGESPQVSCRAGIPVQLHDVSARGVQLQGRFQLEVGERFVLFMRISEHPVTMHCRVCRLIETDDKSPDRIRRIGAEFLQVISKPGESSEAAAPVAA